MQLAFVVGEWRSVYTLSLETGQGFGAGMHVILTPANQHLFSAPCCLMPVVRLPVKGPMHEASMLIQNTLLLLVAETNVSHLLILACAKKGWSASSKDRRRRLTKHTPQSIGEACP